MAEQLLTPPRASKAVLQASADAELVFSFAFCLDSPPVKDAIRFGLVVRFFNLNHKVIHDNLKYYYTRSDNFQYMCIKKYYR
jgi:hypothetical protein